MPSGRELNNWLVVRKEGGVRTLEQLLVIMLVNSKILFLAPFNLWKVLNNKVELLCVWQFKLGNSFFWFIQLKAVVRVEMT